MALTVINTNPTHRDLLVFYLGLPVLAAAVAALRLQAGSPRQAMAIAAIGAALPLLALVVPRLRRAIYVGWQYAVYPIGWTVSHVLMAVTYYGVVTPVGLAMRVLGRDPMARAFDRSAESYWVVRQPNQDVTRYFRQS